MPPRIEMISKKGDFKACKDQGDVLLLVVVAFISPVFPPVHVSLIEIAQQFEFVLPLPYRLQRRLPFPYRLLLFMLVVEFQPLLDLQTQLLLQIPFNSPPPYLAPSALPSSGGSSPGSPENSSM